MATENIKDASLLKLAMLNSQKSSGVSGDAADTAYERMYQFAGDTASNPATCLKHVDSMELIAHHLNHSGSHQRKNTREDKHRVFPGGIHACSLPHVDSVELLSKRLEEEECALQYHVDACSEQHRQWMFGSENPPVDIINLS